MLPRTHTLDVSLGDRSYPIVISHGLLSQAGEHISRVIRRPRVIIVTDSNVSQHHLSNFTASLGHADIKHDTLVVPAGEGSKSFACFETLLNDLLALKPDRKTTLVALGGGVIGDLCGFAASVLLRGVDFIQVPTTLLAQVDSSVGGKTGINTKAGKNLVGAFYQPIMVLIDTATLDSLPQRELLAGYAEILKYGLIDNAAFYEWLRNHHQQLTSKDPEALQYAISLSCETKAAIVAEDEREQDLRAILNFGHTFGHALEAELGYDNRLVHGEAVAIGMIMAARLSEKMGYIPAEAVTTLREHIKEVGLPDSPLSILPAQNWNTDRLCHHFSADKKVQDGKLTFILLREIGQACIQRSVSPQAAREIIEEFIR